MASGTSLRFSVEVAADQAEQALKAMTLAFDQAGVKAKSALGGVGKAGAQAAGGVEQLKASMGKARETAMFFTQSLGELGPTGRTAQIALSGVGGAIMGGGGLLLALSLAQAGVRLLVDYWEEDAKTAAEAAKKHQEAADALAKFNQGLIGDANTRLANLQATRDGLVGVTEAQKAHNEVLKINQDLQLATSPAIRATIQLRLEDAKAKEAQIAALEKLALAEKKAAEEAKKAQDAWKNYQSERERITNYAIDQAKAESDAEEKRLADIAKLGEEANAAAWQRQVEEAQRLTEMEKKGASERKASTDAQLAQYQQVGEAVGTVVGGMISGQMSLGEAVKQVGKEIIGSVIKTATASIMASAAKGGAEAGSSQAGIPVVGPVLAVAAMAAIYATLLGQLSNLPSAAGGWKVPHDTLAMVHEDERILPARYSEGLDRLVNQGGAGSTINVYLTTPDTKTTRRWLLDNSGSVAEAMARAARDGRRG